MNNRASEFDDDQTASLARKTSDLTNEPRSGDSLPAPGFSRGIRT